MYPLVISVVLLWVALITSGIIVDLKIAELKKQVTELKILVILTHQKGTK